MRLRVGKMAACWDSIQHVIPRKCASVQYGGNVDGDAVVSWDIVDCAVDVSY